MLEYFAASWTRKLSCRMDECNVRCQGVSVLVEFAALGARIWTVLDLLVAGHVDAKPSLVFQEMSAEFALNWLSLIEVVPDVNIQRTSGLELARADVTNEFAVRVASIDVTVQIYLCLIQSSRAFLACDCRLELLPLVLFLVEVKIETVSEFLSA